MKVKIYFAMLWYCLLTLVTVKDRRNHPLQLTGADFGQASAISNHSAASQRNLFLLKTHKTGSSTLQNILARYAWENKLFVGLPSGSILFQSYYRGKLFSIQDLQSASRSFNIMFHHMVFNRNEVSSALPEDAIYVTILRDPATLFRSAFKYFRDDSPPFRRAKDIGLDGFLKAPNAYFKGPEDGGCWWLAKNGMFYDLGFDNMNESTEYVKRSIRLIDENFHLVIITEYFDIGILLLKDIMHWTVKDVVYASMNARNHGASGRSGEAPDLNLSQKVYNWNKADTALYHYFNASFWNRVKEFGEEKLQSELKELQFWKRYYRKICFEDDTIPNERVTDEMFRMFSPNGLSIMQYQLRDSAKNNRTCIGMILPEHQWWRVMSYRQQIVSNSDWTLLDGMLWDII